MKGHLRIDKDGVFIDGRLVPRVTSVTLTASREGAHATIEVFNFTDATHVDLADVEIDIHE